MAIYKTTNEMERLRKVDETSFGKEDVLERAGLQRLLRDRPDVLEEGLLIVSEEFGDWQDSSRRIDLLGLDTDGRLVVIELKRGDTGEHMDLQALRYAAMVANMTYDHLIATFKAYIQKRAEADDNPVDEADAEDDAKNRIHEHLGGAGQDNEGIDTKIPRIILASENFGKELTTCVMWLNDSWLRSEGLEIKCVRLRPHRNGSEILIEASVVIPLPEATDYQTRLGRREQEIRSQSSVRPQLVSGGGMFNESIARAEERFQEGLRRLYEFSLDMERKQLAELVTYVKGKGDYIQLQLLIPDKKSEYLVSFANCLHSGGVGEISLWEGWKDLSADSQERMNELVDPAKSPSGVRHRRLSMAKTSDNLGKILDAIDMAYQEKQHRAAVG